jgi:hypothetical protein
MLERGRACATGGCAGVSPRFGGTIYASLWGMSFGDSRFMASTTAVSPNLWSRTMRAFDRLRRTLMRALGRAKDLRGGADQDTRTGLGRATMGVGGRATRRLDHPILSELRWRAACEILEVLGGLAPPRQLRAHVDAVGDPARAIEMLVEDLGCDLEKLRRGVREEQDLFLERLETLVSLDRLLDAAPQRFKELVVHLFHSGDLARLRILSETRSNLQTAHGFCEELHANHRIASVAKLRVEVAAALEDVDRADPVFAREALEAASLYMRVADELALTLPKWTAAMKEATYIWPAAWAALDHPQRKKLGGLERRGSGIMWGFSANEQLSAKSAEQSLAALKRAVEELEALLAEAHSAALHGAKRSSSEGTSRKVGRMTRDSVNDWLAMLDLPAGRAPSHEELRAAYRRIMKKIYPRVNGGDTTAEELVKHINAARDKLRAFYGLA